MKPGDLVMVKDHNDSWSRSDVAAVEFGGRLWVVSTQSGYKGRDNLYWCKSLAEPDYGHAWYSWEVTCAEG